MLAVRKRVALSTPPCPVFAVILLEKHPLPLTSCPRRRVLLEKVCRHTHNQELTSYTPADPERNDQWMAVHSRAAVWHNTA